VTVVWSPRAIGHLAALRGYIARENPGAATRTATTLLAAVDRLAELPIWGGPVGYPALVSSSCQAHGTSFRTECGASVWRLSRCSMAASAGQGAGTRSDTAQTRLPSAPAVERKGKVGVHLKSSARLLQRFQPSIEDCLGRISRAFGAFGFWRNRTGGRDEQVPERRINAIPNESTHAGSVVALPEWISRQRHVCGPAWNSAEHSVPRALPK